MIDLAFVESLIRALDESGLDSLELERGGTKIRLAKSPCVAVPTGPVTAHGPSATFVANGVQEAPAQAVEAPGSDAETTEAGDATEGLIEVKSPMVGTFYAAPAPDADPYVGVGQRVGVGTVLCIIEAMKLMNELESEVSGTVAKILVDNAQPVEYGQVLFLIDPS
jgi:acetyl-CoA carboxylase biotin carboxyl carrier protein